MQQINREQQQASARLTRQLPANAIKETNSPTRHKNVNKISKSSPQRLADLDDFNTHRSLSSCPTYSSLSRHTPETRVSEHRSLSIALGYFPTFQPMK
jgi:hypothetical protein